MWNYQSHIALFVMNQLKVDFLQEGHQILHNFKFNEINLMCDCHFDGVNFLSAYCHTTDCQLREIWEIKIVRFHIYSSQIDIRTDL